MASAYRLLRLAFLLALALCLGTAGARETRESVRAADLPPEAQRTLALIRQGGPFPYAKDGTVFGNFERRLPARPRGHYREYTVPTPGMRTRGAQRIVAGRDGEVFYTRDHYRTFQRVRE